MTAVIRPAEARRNASIRSNSSIRFSLGGVQVDWITKQSPPRTFSRTSIITSPSGKRPTSTWQSLTLRYSHTSRASAGLELPVNISSSSLARSDIFVCLDWRYSAGPHSLPRSVRGRCGGWAGRTRTFECQVQSLVPYQLGDRPAKAVWQPLCPKPKPKRAQRLRAARLYKLWRIPPVSYHDFARGPACRGFGATPSNVSHPRI